MTRQWLLMCVLLCSYSLQAQITLSGNVKDSENKVVSKAHIDLSHHCTFTNDLGYFELNALTPKTYTLQIQKEGFHIYSQALELTDSTHIEIVLSNDTEELEEIIIYSRHHTTENSTRVSQQDIQKNYSRSLAQSLAQEAGVDAIAIGSQNAKPTMRGLGFNRLAVVENGIKQEGQQWGADHGLEIDALQTEQVEIIKGVGAIEYGSDAIAGVVKINNEAVPKKGTHGEGIFTFNSNNLSFGTSLNVSQFKNNHFFKIKGSISDYGDFKVPTKRIRYLNTVIPLQDGIMNNTAGNESSATFQWGYVQDDFKGILTFTHFNSEAGFFSGAHGVPSIQKSLFDGKRRNVDFPKQTVVHNKLMYHAQWNLPHALWDFSTSYQRNHRKELSPFHSHFPNQMVPEVNPNVELDFLLQTWDSKIAYEKDWDVDHKTKVGISYQYQLNDVDGYAYLLPKYNRMNAAAFLKHRWFLQNEQLLDFGLRFDYAAINIYGYFDHILFDYLIGKGNSFENSNAYAQRSQSLNKTYLQPNVSVGYTIHPKENWHSSVTLSSNFRYPTAMELSANGIHHGAFRHEQGNPNLDVERGWVIDWNNEHFINNWRINWSAYAYYFSNYIYLKPSGNFSMLPHGGQIYRYDQSAALLTGVEWDVIYKKKQWRFNWVVELLYNQQLENSQNYPLPFTTPANTLLGIHYSVKENRLLKDQEWGFKFVAAFPQNRIAQNETSTPGYITAQVQWNTMIQLKNINPYVQVGVQNVFNTKYYQHNSFYRPLDIPAMGRSIYCLIKIPF